MIQRREDLAFGAETAQQVVVVPAGADQFHGRLLQVGTVVAFGQPDRAHAALTDLAHQLPGTDAAALPGAAPRQVFIVVQRLQQLGRRSAERGLLARGPGVGIEQAVDLAAKFRIVATGTVEEGRARAGFQFDGLFEDAADLLPAF